MKRYVLGFDSTMLNTIKPKFGSLFVSQPVWENGGLSTELSEPIDRESIKKLSNEYMLVQISVSPVVYRIETENGKIWLEESDERFPMANGVGEFASMDGISAEDPAFQARFANAMDGCKGRVKVTYAEIG